MTEEETRKTPLYERHVEAGAKMTPFAGWQMPIQYDGIKEEHLAVRTHAGMFDVSHMGRLEVEGPEAEAFLQKALSNDIAKIAVGGAQYNLLCNNYGGVVDDLIVYRTEPDRYLIVTNAANHEADLRHLGGLVHEFDCLLRDIADRWAMIAVQGPNARRITGKVLEVDLPRRMRIAETTIAGEPGFVCGTGYTGEDGVELIVAPEVAGQVWRKLLDGGVVPCGLGARDSLRLEACLPLHGNEIDTATNPIEAGLGWCCHEGTGFVGSEEIARVRKQGPDRLLVPFKVEGGAIARKMDLVIDPAEDRPVGVVTSGGYSPSLGIGVGLCYVPTKLAEPGREIHLDVRGKIRAARVAEKPLYRKD